MARKFKRLERRKARRKPKVRFVLVCEGHNTEPRYFKALEQHHKNVLIEIEAIGGVGVPKTIARRAIEELSNINKEDPLEENDQVWAVFDRDEHPYYEEATNQFESHGVKVARSDPCFELWIILHFEEYDKACTRQDLQKRLKTLCGGKDCKDRSFDFSTILDNFETALKRAKRQEEKRINEGGLTPPYTTVHKLVSALNVYFKKR